MRGCICACLLSALPALFAQAPVIVSVVNVASQDARLSPGVVAELRYRAGAPFDAAAARVQIGGKTVSVYDEETGDAVFVRLPPGLEAGPASLVLVTSAGASEPFPITLNPVAPGIFGLTPSLFFDFSPSPFACFHPAQAGEAVSLFAVGLGANGPSSGESKPVITVGGKTVELLEGPVSMRAPGILEDGSLYRFRFAVPPGDGMRQVTISIGGQRSNAVALPVGKAILNLSTPSFSQRLFAAPESIQTAYQCTNEDFTSRANTLAGSSPDLPTSLGGVSIVVKDSAGVERLAPLYGVHWSLVNYVVPAGTAPGLATVTAVAGGRAIGSTDLQIEPVAPDLSQTWTFEVVRLRDGVQSTEQVGQIDLGPETDQVYLVLYGSGFRYRSSLAGVSATIGDIPATVEYAGPQGGQPGLDQVNLRLPRTLAGRSEAVVDLAVDGRHAFTRVSFR